MVFHLLYPPSLIWNLHTYYMLSIFVLQFKSWSTTCYRDADVGQCGWDDLTGVHTGITQINVPRLRDLLLRPLGCLTGRPLKAFQEMFDRFDSSLLENTRCIQASLRNIARAPIHIAEQCRPIIEELIAAQRSSNPNIVGQSSQTNIIHNENNIADSNNGNAYPSPLILLILFISFQFITNFN